MVETTLMRLSYFINAICIPIIINLENSKAYTLTKIELSGMCKEYWTGYFLKGVETDYVILKNQLC